MSRLFAALTISCLSANGQEVTLRPASPHSMPSEADSNSPGHWLDDTFRLYNSNRYPLRTLGPTPLELGAARAIQLDSYENVPMWIEATWVDPETRYVYDWYHHEPGSPCPSGLYSAPKIGALYSEDDCHTFFDLGIVLESGARPDCTGANGYFAGGHDNFTVLLDRDSRYFYFLFSNYGGAPLEQGVAIARVWLSRVGLVQRAASSSSAADHGTNPASAAVSPRSTPPARPGTCPPPTPSRDRPRTGTLT
jgi:hypothetical protein